MIVRRFDEGSGILHVSGTGEWTVSDIEAHYADLRRTMANLRAAGRPVRILSDIRYAERQSREVEMTIRREMERSYGPGDRVVLLTGSDSDKMHVRGALGFFEVKAFSSPIAAEIWLFANETDEPQLQPEAARQTLGNKLRAVWPSFRR